MRPEPDSPDSGPLRPKAAGAWSPRHRKPERPGAGSRQSEPPDAEPTDADLLRQHVAGDPDAFGTLFVRHRDRLWAVAVRTLADPQEAADALQDAMISAFRRAGSFRGDAAVTTWLHRIVVNACLDRMRRRAARPVVSSGDDRLLDAASVGVAVNDPSANSELVIDVTAALRGLPHDQRIALVLVDMLGYSVADAAQVLGISQGTVKSRCARGRARLMPKLAHLRDPGESGRSGAAARAAATAARAASSPPAGRNRSAAGNVLPAQDGGEKAP